jgi:hypothetical protein
VLITFGKVSSQLYVYSLNGSEQVIKTGEFSKAGWRKDEDLKLLEDKYLPQRIYFLEK